MSRVDGEDKFRDNQCVSGNHCFAATQSERNMTRMPNINGISPGCWPVCKLRAHPRQARSLIEVLLPQEEQGDCTASECRGDDVQRYAESLSSILSFWKLKVIDV
jgi:hypothetical protein